MTALHPTLLWQSARERCHACIDDSIQLTTVCRLASDTGLDGIALRGCGYFNLILYADWVNTYVPNDTAPTHNSSTQSSLEISHNS